MKHQWVADSADLGKYGLLRALCDPEPTDEFRPLRLGVVWYLTTDDNGQEPKNDPHAYLKLPDDDPDLPLYQGSDRKLYKALKRIHNSGSLDVGAVERSGILPRGTAYFSDPIPDRLGRDTAAARMKWSDAALARMEGCDLVFLDPDNGLDPNAGRDGQNPSNSAQHVRLDEIRSYVAQEQSVVLYQHPGMNDTMIRQVAKKRRLLWEELRICPFAMVFGRYKDGWLMFLVIPAHKHRERLLARGRAMVDGAWYEHFIMRDGPLPGGVGR